MVTRADNSGSVSSAAVGPVTLPALTGTVSVTGTAEAGQTLTADSTLLGGGGTVSYRWRRGPADIGPFTDIAGATASTYTLETADGGQYIAVMVTRADNSGSVSSAALGPVTLPALTGTVTVTGTAEVGQTLTANTASLGGSGTVSYQWKRGTSADTGGHTAIPSATNSTYTLQTDDSGRYISVTVTRADNSGSVSSAAAGPVSAAAFTVADTAAWNAALTAIQGSSGATFTITVTADLNLPPQDLTAAAYADKTIVLKGDAPSRTLGLASVGSLFTVGADLSLELQDITAQGRADNTSPLIKVNTGGGLAVKTGGTVTGNTYTTTVTNTGGGGIFVDGGTLEIAGGEISGNSVLINSPGNCDVSGGGVLVSGGTVTMSGGSIRNNNVTSSGTGDRHVRAGGIKLNNGSVFTLSGGSIEGNTITGTSTTMCAQASGGGVEADNGSSFTLSGGFIRNNTVNAVSANNWGSATGGGVRIGGSPSSFTMEGGEIYGNTCTYNLPNDNPGGYDMGAYGGGVRIHQGTMLKTGGVIYGSEAAGSDGNGIPYRNLAQDSGGEVADGGQAVMYFAGIVKTAWRDTTANAGDNLDTADSPGTGGWE
jgi:hypothetical protein